jgi:hypothetical protein
MSLRCSWCGGEDDVASAEDKKSQYYNSEEYRGMVFSFAEGPLHTACRTPFVAYKTDVKNKKYTWWLFEEQHGSDHDLTKIVPMIVRARSPIEAYFRAREILSVMYFGPDELVEVHKDYLWAAADGSSVCYEIRKITLPV